jgi:type I restriction enzyme S subunit
VADLPDDWEWSKFGYQFSESDERNGENPPGPLLSVSEYRGVELNTRTDGQKASEDVSHYRVVRPGQLAANMMWLNHGGLGVSTLTGHISPAYKAFWISGTLNPRFAHHMLRSSRYVNYFSAIGTGVRPNSQMVTKTVLDMMPIPVPPAETQRAIADYLDRETGEIDRMIAKMDELTETLEVRRRRAIDTILAGHPRHRLRLVIALSQTGPFGTQLLSSEYVSGGVPLINPSHINRAGISPDDEVSVSPEKAAELSRHLLRPGDIVLGRKGEVDKAALVPDDLGPALCGSDSMLIRADDSVSLPKLLWWFFQSPYCHQQLERMSVGVSVTGLNQVAISQLWMPLPERSDQPKIVADLDKVIGKIDAMLAKVAELKSLLIERRAALITDVVTGRKAVA